MADLVFRAIPVEYSGLFSDDHYIDLQEFGTSLQGLGKLSNSVVDFYLHGRVADPRVYRVRLFAAPPTKSSVLVDIVGVMVGSNLNLYSTLLCDMATEMVIPLIKSVIFKRLKRDDLMDKALDHIVTLSAQNTDFAKQVHEGHMTDKAWLQGHIDKLTERNSGALKELVRPVGSTCRQITVGRLDGEPPVAIGEAEAQAITSREELTVDDLKEYRGIFKGVDKTNGTCKFLPMGGDEELPGKITDPALINPQNPYTHSLDTDQAITIKAKAVLKNGNIVRLFISDGL